MTAVADGSVDLLALDPPYYNNVQYAELSDFFYVWQKRTLAAQYPALFTRRMTNKTDEAVANPVRDGSASAASTAYERLMTDIFRDCRRVLRDDGLMTMMFTHKQQEAWETLTRSLIESGWEITSSFPVESEGENSMHQKDVAAAASSIFITCRKRPMEDRLPSTWTGIGGTGVANKVRESVRQALHDFEPLQLNPVDRMVASYGRALVRIQPPGIDKSIQTGRHWPARVRHRLCDGVARQRLAIADARFNRWQAATTALVPRPTTHAPHAPWCAAHRGPGAGSSRPACSPRPRTAVRAASVWAR
jgi:adenine-specific DNA methylase